MIIKCPQCNYSRDVGDIRVPDKGVMATCPGCRAQFMLNPERPPLVERYQSIRSCPACFYTHSPGEIAETCPQCGLVYAKYLERQRRKEETPANPVDSAAPAAQEDTAGWRRLMRNRTFLGILAVTLIAIGLRFGHDWKLDRDYRLTPSTWQGEMTYLEKQHPFVLVIESAADGKLEGYMDWTETSPRYRLAIRGTYTGNHLVFEDYKFLEGSGAYGLHDWEDVYIAENVMSGSAKNGNAELHAIRTESAPK